MRCKVFERSLAWLPIKLTLCLLVCLCSGLARTATAAPKPTLTEVSRELMCDCPDCGHQSIDQCPAGCAYGIKYRAELTSMIEQGKAKDEIINAFADKHGEHMLGNPRPRGIGLIAPIVPWVGTLIGLCFVMLMLRQMTKRKRLAPVLTTAGAANRPVPEDPRLSAALHDFDY